MGGSILIRTGDEHVLFRTVGTLTFADPAPNFVLVYHIRQLTNDGDMISRAFTTEEAALKFLSDSGMDESKVIGLWALKDNAKIELSAVETPAPVQKLKTWKRKP
jgi:hypothetical protein